MADEPSLIELVAVDEDVLDELVLAATSGASADEVTPALNVTDGWTAERVSWLRSFHRDRRAGLDAPPAREATWVILLDHQVAGSVRLKRTEQDGVLETGIWLTRTARRRGTGLAALDAVLEKAADAGALTVLADTTASNDAALAVLGRRGFTLGPPDSRGVIPTTLRLAHNSASPER